MCFLFNFTLLARHSSTKSKMRRMTGYGASPPEKEIVPRGRGVWFGTRWSLLVRMYTVTIYTFIRAISEVPDTLLSYKTESCPTPMLNGTGVAHAPSCYTSYSFECYYLWKGVSNVLLFSRFLIWDDGWYWKIHLGSLYAWISFMIVDGDTSSQEFMSSYVGFSWSGQC